MSRAVIRTRVYIGGTVRSSPLKVAEASAIVAYAVVGAIIQAGRHGAVIAIPTLEARALHGRSRSMLLCPDAQSMIRTI